MWQKNNIIEYCLIQVILSLFDLIEFMCRFNGAMEQYLCVSKANVTWDVFGNSIKLWKPNDTDEKLKKF